MYSSMNFNYYKNKTNNISPNTFEVYRLILGNYDGIIKLARAVNKLKSFNPGLTLPSVVSHIAKRQATFGKQASQGLASCLRMRRDWIR